ncbi:thioredoxin TrxA [Pelagibaculum spongiae]|uniref:Thioredoxin n=1 Tax=Pelagibaculum spongiae TaxID=2080658 RepID=A0A2V1H4Y6_9GAMM|nr:thioredoxin family protein [Pelagibaculum spongiae]PVZ71835.1 thiol reductase thioredoxin [Pelagibaculum spongiae]
MLDITKDNFEEEVTNFEGVVMIDFWGESCGRCMEIMPDVVALSEQYGDKIKFCKLNIKGGRRLAMKQGVMGLPSMVFYVNGEKQEHLSGEEMDASEIEASIKKYL